MTTTTKPTAPSDRTRVRRIAENAHYDATTLHAILDAAYVCHVAFVDDKGTHCIPTACWREGEHLYIHGSNGGRLIKLLAQGTQACVTVTHIDGLVLARSAFNHSMNYRSAMVYGQFEKVDDKAAALDTFMRHLAPGREHEARPGNDKELAATTVMRISLAEAACKVRTGGPNDDEDDMVVAAWAGVLPLVQQRGVPVADPRCTVPAPAYVQQWAA
ncbi:pyridoxamine 5'-phosphate oxidase family protein [Rhodoferax sp.]|uniref:pyridoxamine 5'-phosphate oxidase family protein n=1 Tax=Rhodoferax sp. TaxID=50421 RepID=UPI002ACEF031|nr:pyridoxamine 5'-phosphate oxidase family protein [Rhodoferax sp.]MDZ7920989.1 pyridoxamine 5'-phosphate oxidase family protein [Rhodoferax sp.]